MSGHPAAPVLEARHCTQAQRLSLQKRQPEHACLPSVSLCDMVLTLDNHENEFARFYGRQATLARVACGKLNNAMVMLCLGSPARHAVLFC